jgi:hypothetical protein
MNTSDIKPPKLRVGIIGVANIAKKNALAIQNTVSNCVISAVGKDGVILIIRCLYLVFQCLSVLIYVYALPEVEYIIYYYLFIFACI